MHDAQEWLDGIIADIPNIRKEMLDDCRTMKTYGKANSTLSSSKLTSRVIIGLRQKNKHRAYLTVLSRT